MSISWTRAPAISAAAAPSSGNVAPGASRPEGFALERVVAWSFFGLVLLASVYLDHHYVVDGIAGMAIAGVIFTATVYLSRRRSR
ncbi:MAG TPA: phosphatase PAP2 family protein [Amycolatopsis sp.]|uniref:phosphatase PAP2 family protein n=1 Tax=Amycolatopsis sp. TaxID=37632 RepID=UPI002B467781|nr:phosphatase PAP2 family protein [Amycolatopsis sp.]HKS49205.1 phosphatase PAP2 family protein [Amycolatopsis sp.]